jgi:hypothetical protein
LGLGRWRGLWDLDDGDQDSPEMEEYEKKLEQAIGVFERSPAHFLQ